MISNTVVTPSFILGNLRIIIIRIMLININRYNINVDNKTQ